MPRDWCDLGKIFFSPGLSFVKMEKIIALSRVVVRVEEGPLVKPASQRRALGRRAKGGSSDNEKQQPLEISATVDT